MQRINLSVVTYNTPQKDLRAAIQSVALCTKCAWHLYIIDNSPTSLLQEAVRDLPQLTYIHRPDNPGYGAAHNIAIRQSIADQVPFHFIMNPDIHFESDILSVMIEYMLENENVGMMMPEVLNRDGSIQFLPKLLPAPLAMFLRKTKRPSSLHRRFIDRYELRNVSRHTIYETPILSGCFTLLNTKAIAEVGLYDERFFLYLEDWDLSRRVHRKYKTLYFPNVSLFHGYEAGSHKSPKLFCVHFKSMFTYFNKWGWFFDKDRKAINRNILQQFNMS